MDYADDNVSDGILNISQIHVSKSRIDILDAYAFYKKIGTGKNGNSIYAKTYVAAIEVRGYDAYFESQTKNHKNKS